MSKFRNTFDRLADWLRRDGKITYRTAVKASTARYVMPLLDRIAADDEDGDTLRAMLIPLRRAERPPVAIYRGDLSTCRIDGPWQDAGGPLLPLGGLVISPGLTAHLDPLEAMALHQQLQQVIEDTIVAWAQEHELYPLCDAPQEIDREVADPIAKAMIAAWVLEQQDPYRTPKIAPTKSGDCCSGESVGDLCKACRKGSNHA